ncbi:hypothetical protein GGX14DRAFT_678823 [Mycena pura]|uniref:Uncharacterized protein n=1 Tax=Mycena pura TaxID=153505 RepID=A0AAD6UVL6_9AGAR|nr:hypothetical protein GGX14DRAFT_678823 [Mycena pura]
MLLFMAVFQTLAFTCYRKTYTFIFAANMQRRSDADGPSYRKTFTFIFAANMIGFVARKGGRQRVNLMVTLLFRQENFVNLLYEIAVSCAHSAPLWLRRQLAKVFHYGGAHSGSGVAAVVWYIMYTAVTTRDYIISPGKWALANLVTSCILVAMFCFILGAAHPTLPVRRRYHDYFEAVHRYSGRVALLTFNALRLRGEPAPRPRAGRAVARALPNRHAQLLDVLRLHERLRRQTAYPEKLSDHAITPAPHVPRHGAVLRADRDQEWHAFATILDDPGDGSGPKVFSVVVSNAGDWTRACIQNSPEKLWVHGLLYTSHLFKKVVIVATGSGIGPCLSLFYANATPRRIFWSTPNPLITYGAKIMQVAKAADPDAWIWGTHMSAHVFSVILPREVC